MKITGDHEALSIVCHVGLHVHFSSRKSSLGLEAFTFVGAVNLDGLSPPFRPMRALRLKLEWAFSLVCEVALRCVEIVSENQPGGSLPELLFYTYREFECLYI